MLLNDNFQKLYTLNKLYRIRRLRSFACFSCWVLKRYGTRIEAYQLPKSKSKKPKFEQVGADGLQLLKAIDEKNTPSWLSELDALRTMHQIWIQNYTWTKMDD